MKPLKLILLLFILILATSCASGSNKKLLKSAEMGNLSDVESALNSGANLEARESRYGNTALHLAAFEGKQDVVVFLLDRGIDPNIQANDGITPLIAACRKGHLNIAKTLISKGANPNLADEAGITPLMAAAYSDNYDLVRFLLISKAKAKLQNLKGKTALDKARSDKIKGLIQQYKNREK
jgi:ankyrin repeat protein